MLIYEEIRNALFRLIEKSFPCFSIFGEEITKIQADDFQREVENYFYVDIMPIKVSTISQYHCERTVLIDLAGYTKSELNSAYLEMAAMLDAAIRPAFRFGDRAITINEAEVRVVDNVLHYTFPLTFIDTIEVIYEEEMMEELDVTIKERM